MYKNRSHINWLAGWLVLLSVSSVSAQSLMRGWELGPWGGVSYYFGDLNTNYRLNRPNAAGGMLARYNFNDRISLSLSGNYGKVEAYDNESRNAFEYNRNLSFQSTIWDASLLFEFNFLPYIHGSRDHFFTPYMLGGLSVFNFNPMAEYDGPQAITNGSGQTIQPGDLVALRPLGTEGQFKGEEYYITTTAWTYGMGLKFDLTYEWSMNIHVGVRATRTDYLDDVSTLYPDRSDLARDRSGLAVYMSSGKSRTVAGDSALGIQGQQRGDSSRNDVYLFAGVGMLYYFGDVRCPGYGAGTRR
ncbi:MAG: DUF6089 family protein [Saprospiraceae bacterium]